MKKWMYLIFPTLMLGLFLVFYFSHKKDAEAQEAAKAAEMAKKDAEEAKKKADAEKAAADNARENQKKHEEEERQKEETRVAKQAAADKEVKDTTDGYLARGDKASKEVAAREIELDTLHKQRDALNRATFDAAKEVELAKIARRNAELETQRMLERVSKLASESILARMPPPPPAAPAPKS
jgi:hypothetical protein